MSGAPTVSVLIASYNSAAVIEPCLTSLEEQCSDGRAEVIVVDSGSDDAAAKVAEAFPWVVLLRSPERLYPGAARNLGASRAAGEVLAFVDADCVAAPDWIDRIVDFHRRDEGPVVGGAILNHRPRGGLDWAAYFCSFHLWTPLAPAAHMMDIPTCNLSYERSAFERFGPFRERGFSSDTELNWKVAAAGRPPTFDPSLRVLHSYHPTLRSFLCRQFVRGRAFGALRVRQFQWSLVRRWAQAVATPVVPFLLVGRLATRVVSGRRRSRNPEAAEYSRSFWRSLPQILAGFGWWSVGEMLGYLDPAE